MSKLYDIVNKTINAKSLNEAEQILFGSDGIVINSDEYYKNIISNFGKKKESIIRKTVASNGKTQLIFDLNNCNDMWNILFIYNYYIRYIDEKIESLDQEINKYKSLGKKLETEKKELTLNDEKYQEITKELERIDANKKILDDLKNKYSSYKNESLKKHIVQLENMENVDEDKLKQHLDKLKEAVCCIQKIRDSLEHSNDNLHIDNVISIDNSKDKFELSIPIEYLDGFNKGRIIANENDKILVQQTNNISSPLLEALDFDVKKINSFFYNIEPSYLEFLLEKFNYDVEKLYQLSTNVFYNKEVTISFLKKGINIFDISILSNGAFEYVDNAIKLIEKGIDITKLPYGAFEYADNAIELIEKGIDITKLPDDAFECSDITTELIEGLTEKGIDVCVLKLSNSAFHYIEGTIELISILIEKGINIDFSKLPRSAYFYPKNTVSLIDILSKKGIDITKLPDDAFTYADNTIKLIERLTEKNIDIFKLPHGAFYSLESTMSLIDILIEKGIDITKLSDYAFKYSDNAIKLIEKGIDITRLPDGAFKYADNTIKLIERLIKKNIDIEISKLPNDIFYSSESIISLIEISINKGIDINKLPDDAFKYSDNAIKLIEKGIDITRLPDDAFTYVDNAIKLIERLSKNGIDWSKIPQGVFCFPERVIELMNKEIDITKLPKNVFYFLPYRLDAINIVNIPDNLLYYVLKTFNLMKEGKDRFFGPCIKNLKEMIEKIGYEQLDTLPIEFFQCNSDLLDEMFKRYNSNISKSIFGIKNPKIIGALVYANSVLSNYNKDINTTDMNIQPYSIIGDMYVDNFKYRNNIEENIGREYNSSEFVEQFKLLDENNFDRSMDDIRKTILNKFRNACAHFRFKLVKDNAGNIIEDKIYIYDEDNNGINNFNLIIDLNEFISIVREVEVYMEIQKNKDEQSAQKSR